MSAIDFGDPPVGFTYRAENHPATTALVIRVAEDHGLSLTGMLGGAIDAGEIEVALDRVAHLLGIDRSNEFSFDSDVFPKPVFAEQLTCTDRSWSELAPDHYMVPIGASAKYQSCAWCGETPDQGRVLPF